MLEKALTCSRRAMTECLRLARAITGEICYVGEGT